MQNIRTKLVALGAFLVLSVAGGCASPVPGGLGRVTGTVLNVSITTYGQMYPQYYYYFVINHVGSIGDSQGRGPIPVLGQTIPGYGGLGNGFATGSPSPNSNNTTNGVTDYGITDYVVYNNYQPNNGIALYHIGGNGDPNIVSNAMLEGYPSGGYTLPDPNNNPFTLTFTLPISQLFPNLTGTALTTAVNQLRYIQVNIIATTAVPTDQTNANGKQVDSMGNSQLSSNLTSYLLIDLSQNGKSYTDQGPYPVLICPEPKGDVYVYPTGTGSYSDSVDLQSWSITVTQQ